MPKKVLIVDDEQDWVKMLAMRLQHEGFEVEAAFDAIQAMTQTKKVNPDLILLDIQMPAGGGITVLKNLKNNIKTFIIPIIITSGKSPTEIEKETEGLDVSGYFVKSEDVSKLIGKIKEILR